MRGPKVTKVRPQIWLCASWNPKQKEKHDQLYITNRPQRNIMPVPQERQSFFWPSFLKEISPINYLKY